MAKGPERPKWRVPLAANDDKVRFSVQGYLGRRALWVVVAVIALVLCALIAPEIAAEIARLLKSFAP